MCNDTRVNYFFTTSDKSCHVAWQFMRLQKNGYAIQRPSELFFHKAGKLVMLPIVVTENGNNIILFIELDSRHWAQQRKVVAYAHSKDERQATAIRAPPPEAWPPGGA